MMTLQFLTTPPKAKRDEITRLVQQPLPPFPSDEATAWVSAVRSLKPGAERYLLEYLKSGKSDEQYSALIALRTLGDEAWAEGYDDNIEYFVRHEGQLLHVKPSTREIEIV